MQGNSELKLHLFTSEVRTNANIFLKYFHFTPCMEVKEKIAVRHRLGLTILSFLSSSQSEDDNKGISSLRKLAAASGTEYAIIQKISTAKKDPQFSTVLSIIEGLGISLTEFAEVFDSIPDKEVTEYQKQLEKKQKDSRDKSLTLKPKSKKKE